MRKIFLYIFTTLISICSIAQSSKRPLLQDYIGGLIGQQLFIKQAIDGINLAENVSEVLSEKIIVNYPTSTKLALAYTRTSPSGTYYTYNLKYEGVSVYGNKLKVFVDRNNVIRWAHHNFVPYYQPAKNTFLNKAEVRSFAKNNYPNQTLQASENTWVNNGETLIPSFAITLKNTTRGNTNKYIHGITGELLYRSEIDKYLTTTDTPAYGYVYNPDPLTTAQVQYGGIFSDSTYRGTDSSTADNAALTAERQKVKFNASLLGDSVVLSNNDFFIGEVSAPSWPVTYVTLGDTFNYTRGQHQFADVNAFYHLNFYLAKVRQLGFNNLPGYRIKVDAHALNGQDASRFTSGDNPPTLQFGDGGVPDAEDADVIIHEFGHALSFGASPNTSIGLERRAMEEGIGDYFAASYSWNISAFNWQKVFTWDGNNGGWQGRTVDYKGSYNQLTNNIWTDGQLLSTAFMRLFRIIGRDKTDALMLEGLYRFNSSMSMTQFANAIQQVDTIQNGGANYNAIQCSFAMVNILDSVGGCPILSTKETKKDNNPSLFKIYNSWGFANAGDDALVTFDEASTYQLSIFDAFGKLIVKDVVTEGYKKIQGQNFAPGIYILKVSEKSTGKVQAAKLLRY